ncbi:carboxymuconolactone decarboxylase family protein [Micromonospora costi]|uniref:Alkyl hydroperoxide reductase AhpD n=1 Tax=Micromonospora costi TaxID=1530042 RepID=A0A3B0AC89_9ACTN|nr:carboxymuconolactone decarboxylase family protein [Micromonospora costi]RKN58021.1 alkyl hydroperoxide reductase [Micromonospora costi]
MGLDAITAGLPAYARDVGLTLDSTIGASPLEPQQLWGTALACAVAARNPVVLREIAAEAATHLPPEAVEAAKAAATIMAMTNVYYRATHLLGDEAYRSLPARLRMRIVARPGVPKVDFEFWCLAVSAINGCAVCLESHEGKLRAAGLGPEQIQEGLRIAAAVQAAAVAYDAEAALA